MSNFLTAYKIELIKLAKRKDMLLLLLMPVMSLFYSIGYASGVEEITYTGEMTLDAFSFIGTMIQMVHAVFIFYIFFGFIVARSLSSEIEDKSMLFYLPRLKSRGAIYYAKGVALVTVILISLVFFIAVSLWSYYGFLITRADVANGLLFQADKIFFNIAAILCFIYILVFSICLLLALSTRLKLFIALSVYILIIIVFVYVSQFEAVQYLSPLYYIRAVFDDGADSPKLLLLSTLWCAISGAVLTVIGRYNFCKKDL